MPLWLRACDGLVTSLGRQCGDQKMAPHVNKLSPLDGAHELQVTVIDTTSELS